MPAEKQAVAPFYVVLDDQTVMRFPELAEYWRTGIEVYDIDEYEFWDSIGQRLIATAEGKQGLDIRLRLDHSIPPDPAVLAGRIATFLRLSNQFDEVRALLEGCKSDALSEIVSAFDEYEECSRRRSENRRLKNRLVRTVKRLRGVR